jgi:anti-anti-sigma factor
VFLRGEMDLSRGEEITTRIDRALATPGVDRIVVDLADVTFLDCYSIGELITGRRHAAVLGVDVFVIHPDVPLVRQVLDITGVCEILMPTTAR